MRKLMAMAIGLVIAGATSSWALFGLGDVTFDGSLEVSGNSAKNETDFSSANDHRGNTATRTRVGMNATVTEGVMGRLEAARSPRLYGTGATTVAGEEALWSFQNAYVHFDDLLGFKVRLGRQYVGEAGDRVWNISPVNDDSLTLRSIDGLLVQCRHYEKVDVDLFTGKASEDDGVADTDAGDVAGDVNLSNLEVGLRVIPDGRIRVAYLMGTDSNTAAESDNNKLRTGRVGVNGSLSDNMFTYRAEFLQNMGEFKGAGLNGSGVADDLDYKGNAIDLGAGYNSPETQVGTFGLWANYVTASGDDNVRDNEDESFHDFSGLGLNTSDRLFGEIFGKSNTLGGGTPLGQGVNSTDNTGIAPSGATQGQGIQVLNIGGRWKPTFVEKTWLKLDFFSFTQPEDSVKITDAGARANVGDDIGTEFDVTLGYDHSDNVALEAGYAMLSPDDVLTGVGATNDEEVTKLFARTKIKWGGEEK